MTLLPLGELHLKYARAEYVDFGVDGQYVGCLEGTFTGDAVQGKLWMVNVSAHRPDGVNTPHMSGVLRTCDGADLFVEMRGLASQHGSEAARRFTTSLLMRTTDTRYAWLNVVLGVVEGALEPETIEAVGRAYWCANELAVTT